MTSGGPRAVAPAASPLDGLGHGSNRKAGSRQCATAPPLAQEYVDERIPRHECQLPGTPHPTRNELRREAWRSACLVSRKHPLTKRVFKSSAAISAERRRHIDQNGRVLHPFSVFRLYWELSMLAVQTVSLAIIPMNGMLRTPSFPRTVTEIFTDLISFTDVLLELFTGYYDSEHKRVYLKQPEIMRRRLGAVWCLRLVSTLPLYYMCVPRMFQREDMERKERFLTLLYLLKFPRTINTIKYLKTLGEVMSLSYVSVRIMSLGLLFCTYLHWASCIQILIAQTVHGTERSRWPETTWLSAVRSDTEPALYVNALFYTLSLTLSVSSRLWKNQEVEEVILTTLIALVGNFFFLYSVVMAIVWTRISNITSSKYENKMNQMREFLAYERAPPELTERMISFLNFCYHKYYFREARIMDFITGQMKQEILLHSCQKLVAGVPLFRNVPLSVMVHIVLCLRSEVYLPNDVVVKAGTPGSSMFFIASGTVAIYAAGGWEICHLDDGAHFGEIALVSNEEMRVASVVTVEMCELYALEREDFLTAVAPFPELLATIADTARQRLDQTIRVDKQSKRFTFTLDHDGGHQVNDFNSSEDMHVGSDESDIYMSPRQSYSDLSYYSDIEDLGDSPGGEREEID